MKDLSNSCLTCLSTDRLLVSIDKIFALLQAVNISELKDLTGGICWECCRFLINFHRYKKRAQMAQEALTESIENNHLKPLTTLTTKINHYYDFTFNFDHSTEPKNEPNLIKEECEYQGNIVDNVIVYEENITEEREDIESVYEKNIDTSHNAIFFLNTEKTSINDRVKKPNLNNIDVSADAEKYSKITDAIKQQFDYQNDHIDNITDNEDNLTEARADIESVYVEAVETPHSINTVVNTENTLFNDEDIKPNLDNITEDVYAETIKIKPPKKNIKNVVKRKKRYEKDINSKRNDEIEFQEKFLQVVLTEEELKRVREEKRNHHNYKKIPYKCDTCVLGFTMKENFNVHMKKKHDESIGNHICDVCSIRFASKLSLNNHRLKHYVCYRCRLCKYEAHEIWSAVNHCKAKHSEDDGDAVVKTSQDLEVIQTEHTLFCNECGTKFKSMNTLRRHNARIHAVKRDFICDICKKTFNTKTRLESHIANHDASIAKQLAYCYECNIQYKNIYVYRGHLKTSANHSERAYSCPVCNKKFASKVYGAQHYNFYHLRKSRFNCEICNKQFISHWRLKNHKQKHHGMSRSRDHACSICSKKFFTATTLRTHQLTHSEQRSYMCEDCGDTFKQSAALYTHTRLVHRGGNRK